MDKVFHSDITRSKTHKNNDLKDLCKVVPATPIVINTVINLDCDFNPRNDKVYVPKRKSKFKVRTVRDIRNQFEKDILDDLPNYLERQQNLLLRKIRDGTANNDQTKVIAKNILNSDEPITRSSWQMLMNINPERHEHPSQYVRCIGKPIRINGCRGGSNKFILDLNSGKAIKQLKKNNQNKTCFKKKYMLRNSLSVNFKPGPLSRKNQLDNSYQKYNVGDIELIGLPKAGLEIRSCLGRTLDPIASLINNFRDVNGVISEKWAEFAVSVVKTKSASNLFLSNESPLIFDLNYKCDQRRILMRRNRDGGDLSTEIKCNSKIIEIPETDEFGVIPEIRVMMNKMLDAVDINLNQDKMYSGDEEPRENDSFNNSTCSVKDKSKRKYCELDRLDVTVIRLPENEQNNLSTCLNSFCLLGCVCDSLQSAIHLKGHCGRVKCMFGCKCDLSKYSIISDHDGECFDLLPGLINLEKEMNHKLAKEEQKFHQTVIVTGNQSIVLKNKKRHVKSSKKYADYYGNRCLKSDSKLNPVLSITLRKLECENIEPWCMVHNLYKCFCKGKFTDAVTNEKVINENEKCLSLLDKDSHNVDCCVSNDNDRSEKSRIRLRKDKNIVGDGFDKELDLHDTCSNDSNQSQKPGLPMHDKDHVETSRTGLRKNKNTGKNGLNREPDDTCKNDSNKSLRPRPRRHTATYGDSDDDVIDLDSFSCARVRMYDGRKFSLGYYLHANKKINYMESNDKYLRNRLDHLIDKSINMLDLDSTMENNVMEQEHKPLSRSERLKRRREKAMESVSAENKSQIIDLESTTKSVVQDDPKVITTPLVSTSQSNCNTDAETSFLKMIDTSTDKLISKKPQLVAWLESSYKQYKKRLDMGITKHTLEPPQKGKVCLYPWDFILSRYSERKNLFLISKNQPFRIFMAVDSKNPQFEHCINIDEIRFADLCKYPLTVKNLLTNTSGLKENFCILFGLTHCWELIGSVMKIDDSKEKVDSDSSNDVSDQTLTKVSGPLDEAFRQSNLLESISDSASCSDSKEACSLQSPNKIAASESSKWFVMTVENDFSEIQFYNKGFFVKYESIKKAINVARVSAKTVRLSSQKCADKTNCPQFGIYAIPNSGEDCVFVGPYETEESLGIETVKILTNVKRQREKTRGVWIITNKVDNLKVIDNPLSFMPSEDVQKNEMLSLDNASMEDNNKLCTSVNNMTVQKTSEIPVKVTSEKHIKVVKPIKIRKSDSRFCRIAPKSLLKVTNQSYLTTKKTFSAKRTMPFSSEHTLNSYPIIVATESQSEIQPLNSKNILPSALSSEMPMSTCPIIITTESQSDNQTLISQSALASSFLPDTPVDTFPIIITTNSQSDQQNLPAQNTLDSSFLSEISIDNLPIIIATESQSEKQPEGNTNVFDGVETSIVNTPLPIIIATESQSEKQPEGNTNVFDEVEMSIENTPLHLKLVEVEEQNKDQKVKKPVAEVAPQIKIATVFSEAVEKVSVNNRPDRTMFILKPEEINKRHFEKNEPKAEESFSTPAPDASEDMDIEDFLDCSAICTAPIDETLIISDDEEEPALKEVWIQCTNVDGFGLIPARINDENEISFQFPGFKQSEFYLKDRAFVKIHQVLSRKVYIPSNFTIEWDIIDSKDKIENFKLLKAEDFTADLVLTRQGLRHKNDLIIKTSTNLKTYSKKKPTLQSSSISNSKAGELKDPALFPEQSMEAAIVKSIIGASAEDRQQFTNTLEQIMQDNDETSLFDA